MARRQRQLLTADNVGGTDLVAVQEARELLDVDTHLRLVIGWRRLAALNLQKCNVSCEKRADICTLPQTCAHLRVIEVLVVRLNGDHVGVDLQRELAAHVGVQVQKFADVLHAVDDGPQRLQHRQHDVHLGVGQHRLYEQRKLCGADQRDRHVLRHAHNLAGLGVRVSNQDC